MIELSIVNRIYGIDILGNFTAYSVGFFLTNISQGYEAIQEYMNRIARKTGYKLQPARLDGADRREGELVSLLQRLKTVTLKFFPPYGPPSYREAERIIL